MKRGIAVAVLALAVAACSKTEDPHKLVSDADAMLVAGGIEDAKTRSLAEQKYDRAIRIICGEDDLACVKDGGPDAGGSPGTNDYALAHAHFGLAFARSFDLVERIRQLYESGTILQPEQFKQKDSLGLDEEETSTTTTEDVCKQQLNLPQLVPLLKTIVETSLLPIVKDLKSVTNYGAFNIAYKKAFLDFKFLNPSVEEAFGVEFGTDETSGLPGTFTVKEAYAALAVFRVLTIAAEGLFSYNDLTQALIVFLPKLDTGAEARPFEVSKMFNRDECAANPLFDAAFGVLTEDGSGTYADVEVQLGEFFAEQKAGFDLIAAACKAGDKNSLINCTAKGAPWASNLAKRIFTGDPKDDANLETSITIITGAVPPESIGKMFAKLSISLNTGRSFSLFDDVPEIAELLNLKGIDASKLGVPALSLRQLFSQPISDLKSIMPLTYASDEPTSYETAKSNEHQVSKQEMPIAEVKKGTNTMSWTDVNGDGHLNNRGDFIVQTEREPFYDDNNDNDPLAHVAQQVPGLSLGIVGAFWDGDMNGAPDAGFENLTPGANRAWAAVTNDTVVWDKALAKLVYATAATWSEGDTYRDYFDAGKALSNGCLDYVPVAPEAKYTKGRDSCNVEVGNVLGHVWPNVFPEAYVPPAASDNRRKDPANGSVDRIYMFYPNPSFNGMLQTKDAAGRFRPFENHELNRFVASLLDGGNILNKISAK
jgi:hypothetical protein